MRTIDNWSDLATTQNLLYILRPEVTDTQRCSSQGTVLYQVFEDLPELQDLAFRRDIRVVDKE
jgi:hypothetical protein